MRRHCGGWLYAGLFDGLQNSLDDGGLGSVFAEGMVRRWLDQAQERKRANPAAAHTETCHLCGTTTTRYRGDLIPGWRMRRFDDIPDDDGTDDRVPPDKWRWICGDHADVLAAAAR